MLMLGALPLVPALPVFALAAMVVLAVRRMPQLTRRLRRPLRVGVPVVLSLFAANAGIELWSDAIELL